MILTIIPRAPFDFDLSSRIFSTGDRQIRKYENGEYWQVIRVGSKLFLAVIRPEGTVDNPKLRVELRSKGKISSHDNEAAKEIITSLFNLDFDLNPFYRDVKNDMVLLDLSKRLRGLKSPTTENVFEAMVCSIVEQQISLILAHKMEEKIIKAFGDVLNLRDGTYYAFPTSQRLAAAKIAQLRKCGLSSRKSEYIRDVAKLIVDKKLNLEKFKISGDVGEIISELCKIRGVGVWTAEMAILRGLRRLENIPADDVSLQRCISHFYFGGRRISSEELRKLAENWGKWKGLVGFYLVIAEIMDKVRD